MRNIFLSFIILGIFIFVAEAGAQSIDGVPIGATTPSTGKFTTLEATSFVLPPIDNTPIGATTPSTGKFTSLEATSFTIPPINNTSIGSITPSTGKFTSLEATSLSVPAIDGATIGSTTPSTGNFTSIDVNTLDANSITIGSKTITQFNQVLSTMNDGEASYLNNELVEGNNITFSEVDFGGNIKLRIDASSPGNLLQNSGELLTHNGTNAIALGTGGSGQVLTTDGTTLSWEDPHLFNANVLLNAYRTATYNDLPVLKMINGSVDAFKFVTGVNAAASSLAVYDPTNDFYKNEGGSVSNEDISNTTGVRYQYVGDSGNVEVRVSQAFNTPSNDITVSQVDLAFNDLFGSISGDVTVQIETDASGKPSGNLAHPDATHGIPLVPGTFSVANVNSWNFPNSFTLNGSTKYWIVVYMDDQAPGSYVIINVDTSAGYSGGGYNQSNDGGATWMAERSDLDLNFKVYATSVSGIENMTLVSNSQSAKTEPAHASTILMADNVNADIVLNTDVIAYVSRDGGTTFTQVSLSDAGEFEKGNLWTGTVEISSQPSGTDMVWKVETDNNKVLNLHGVGLEWR